MSEHLWALTDHACQHCLGRVLERVNDDGRRISRCSNCGAEGEGHDGLAHPPICACGARLGKRDAGIRCVRNDRPRPGFVSEIIVREAA